MPTVTCVVNERKFRTQNEITSIAISEMRAKVNQVLTQELDLKSDTGLIDEPDDFEDFDSENAD